MAIICTDLVLAPGAQKEEAVRLALKKCHLTEREIRTATLYKESIDARHGRFRLLCSVLIDCHDQEKETALCAKKLAKEATAPALLPPEQGTEPLLSRPVVVGFGPAGMFAALTLARAGYAPLVLEQGEEIEKRSAKVASFWAGGALDSRTNVQFGEGGAGTFSDGKLNTRINDPFCRAVLEDFVAFGAPEEIRTKAKPHVGTDQLKKVVKNLRREVLRLGGEICFSTCLTDFETEQGVLSGCVTEKGIIPAQAVILAPGHSARALYETLAARAVPMEQKPFSVGLRIEHLQADLDQALLHRYAGDFGPASYQLSYRQAGRGVYTFCMCPGGQVVSSGSAEGELVTNGMSAFARDGKNGNSALVADVDGRDFGGGLLDGVRFQETLERAAYQLGGGKGLAPCQTVGGFLTGTDAMTGRIQPSFAPGVQMTAFNGFFPARIEEMLKAGITVFGRRLRGFDAPDSLLTGVETRTSAPLRVLRNEQMISAGLPGLYPCGEGCGYAGGIMSAAVDGIRSARAVIAKYRSPQNTERT